MEYEGFLELVKTRRSIRRFKTDTVPDELINKVLEAGRWAPSGFNTQPWEFVVVKDRKLKDEIVQIVKKESAHTNEMEAAREAWQTKPKVERPSGQPAPSGGDYSDAPVFIILLGDTRVNVALPMSRRYNYTLLQRAYVSSLANAMMYMQLATTMLGLASQWVSATGSAYGDCLVKKLLGIPNALEIYDTMALGYGASEPRPRLVRELTEMVHHDYCGEAAFRNDQAVKDFVVRLRNP